MLLITLTVTKGSESLLFDEIQLIMLGLSPFGFFKPVSIKIHKRIFTSIVERIENAMKEYSMKEYSLQLIKLLAYHQLANRDYQVVERIEVR